MKKNLQRILYKSFDTDLPSDEKKMLEQGLSSDRDLARLRDQISELRRDVERHGKENFPPTFDAGLSRKVAPIFRLKDLRGMLPDELTAAFRKVSISGAIVLLLLVLYNLSAGNDNILKNFLGGRATTMNYAYDPSVQPLWTDTR